MAQFLTRIWFDRGLIVRVASLLPLVLLLFATSSAHSQNFDISLNLDESTVQSTLSRIPLVIRVSSTVSYKIARYSVTLAEVNGTRLSIRERLLTKPTARGAGWVEFTLSPDIRHLLIEGTNLGSVKVNSIIGSKYRQFTTMVDTQPPSVTLLQQNPLRFMVADGSGTGLSVVRPWVVTADGQFTEDRPTVVFQPPPVGTTTTLEVNQNASWRWDGSLIDLIDGAGHRTRFAPSGRPVNDILAEVAPPVSLPVIPETSSGSALFGNPCRFERIDLVSFFNQGIETAQVAGARLAPLSDVIIDALETTENALKAHRYDLGIGLRPNGDEINERLTGYTAQQVSQNNLPVTFFTLPGQTTLTGTRLDIDDTAQMNRLRAFIQGLSISASPKTLVLIAVDELMKGASRATAIGLAYGGGTDGFVVFETGASPRQFTFPNERIHLLVHELGHLMGLDHADQANYRDPTNANVETNFMLEHVAVTQNRFTLRQATRYLASLCGPNLIRHEFNRNPHFDRKVWEPNEVHACNNGVTGFDEETESAELLNSLDCLDGGPMPPVVSSSGVPRPEARAGGLPANLDERWCWCFGQYSTFSLGRTVNRVLQVPTQSEDRIKPKTANRPAVIDIAFHDPAVTANIYASKTQVTTQQYETYIRSAEKRIAVRLAPDEQLVVKTAVVGQNREWTLEIWAPSRPTINTGIKFSLARTANPYGLILRTDTGEKVPSPPGTGYFAPGR